MQNLLYDSMIDRIGASKSFLVKKKQTNKQKLPNPPSQDTCISFQLILIVDY